MMEISKTTPSEEMSKTGRGTFLKEVRCAVRFPLSLPVEMADDKLHESSCCHAQRFGEWSAARTDVVRSTLATSLISI